MKKIPLLLLLLSLGCSPLVGQDSISTDREGPQYSLRADAGGQSSLVSLSLERIYFLKPAFKLTLGGGIGYLEEFNLFGDEHQGYATTAIQSAVLLGGNRSFLELGAGACLIISQPDTRFVGYPLIGYRFHNWRKGGFVFRVGFSYPLFQHVEDLFALPGYFSFGFAF
jgi:hypothetical protein